MPSALLPIRGNFARILGRRARASASTDAENGGHFVADGEISGGLTKGAAPRLQDGGSRTGWRLRRTGELREVWSPSFITLWAASGRPVIFWVVTVLCVSPNPFV